MPSRSRFTAFAAVVAACMILGATAQAKASDHHQPDIILAQEAPAPVPDAIPAPEEGAQPGQPGKMGERMRRGMGMRGHMMKIMFAIADTDGDGAMSFEEVTAIHKRIFDAIDTNKDGKMTMEEFQAFARE